MASVKTFFRKCPECGHRFEVKETEKKLENTEAHTEEYDERQGLPPVDTSRYIRQGGVAYTASKKPVTVIRKEYRLTYRCSRCGHEWAEKEVDERQSRG
jgi:DNA-directed RNA polymerase subunit RPC12/RpoP